MTKLKIAVLKFLLLSTICAGIFAGVVWVREADLFHSGSNTDLTPAKIQSYSDDQFYYDMQREIQLDINRRWQQREWDMLHNPPYQFTWP